MASSAQLRNFSARLGSWKFSSNSSLIYLIKHPYSTLTLPSFYVNWDQGSMKFKSIIPRLISHFKLYLSYCIPFSLQGSSVDSLSVPCEFTSFTLHLYPLTRNLWFSYQYQRYLLFKEHKLKLSSKELCNFGHKYSQFGASVLIQLLFLVEQR